MTAAAVSTDASRPADGLRDTFDSIIIAFILAFVFRAFIIEAFIIPTGSMAPTLYGQHGQMRCANCAYPFAYNIPQNNPDWHPRARRELTAVDWNQQIRCPNCGNENEVPASPANPLPPNSGDRILVFKWPYDIGGALLGPKRWDVSVFKEPMDSRTNYIKRLIGLPGDVLEIIDGDIYAARAADVPEGIRNKLNPSHRSELSEADFRALDRVLKLQRKTSVAQESLWLLHYDHDFLPARRDAGTPAWTPDRGDESASGWNVAAPRVRFDGRAGDDSFLTLTGRPIQDSYGYNNVRGAPESPMFVGDVRMEFVLDPVGAGGRLVLSLTKDDLEFRATISAEGDVDLGVIRPNRPDYVEPLDHARIGSLIAQHRPIAIAFENVDYRVRLEIDGGGTILQSRDDAYRPDLRALRHLQQEKASGGGRAARVRIGAAGWPLELWHLRVLRDVYYRPHPGEIDNEGHLAKGGSGTLGHPILLRPGEYFMCGDNSPQSFDSRMWIRDQTSTFLQARGDQYQVGTVPEDQMIGRAFFVYWPSGNRPFERSGIPLLPNTGRMRIIR